ncbi:hypothetical protein BDY19DRAFT_938639 [Irpex rosettiformis]|uniref:Uncharacterized protein n=1 Tax=Irpex rosettiformis TaxID=378272 RepID=A0ACB8U766_9APHY|nr:hypothetical protein BDY19DRAFT_938639 [Irpex rosettiformis]
MPAARFDKSKKPYSRPSRPRRSDGDWVHDKAPENHNIKSPRAQADTSNGTVPNSKLLVSNLHYEITPKDLTQIFGQIGTLVREPLIRYDRSGRSSGVAVISYETAAEARKALDQFDQKLCKGQPMTITFDAGPPARQARRVASAPSLINRIQKPPLAERLGTTETKHTAAPARTAGAGPIRNKGHGGARPAKEPKKPKNTPKTAEELDMELDAFMKDDSKPATVQPVQAAQVEDVDMAV